MVGDSASKPGDKMVPGHAETLLGALELKNKDGSVNDRLIKMRNPYGFY